MKRSIRVFFITIVMSLGFIFSLTGCSRFKFEINFIVNGEIYETVGTNGNDIIKMPEDPVKEDFFFEGWYWDEGTWEKSFTANSLLDAPLSSDMNVYAYFISVEENTPPTEEYIVNGVKAMPNVLSVEAVTEHNDPNGLLNKDGGYISCVYFSLDVIDQDNVYGTTLVDKGTDAGGCVEIYANKKDALNREKYLSSFDATMFASGSHEVVRTCVIRVANSLTASQQNIVENNLIKLISHSEEEFVSLDTYLKQVAKQLAEEGYLSALETTVKLIELGYPSEKSAQIALSCGVDYKQNALLRAEALADYYATVYPKMIKEFLEDYDFYSEEIEYALSNMDIDWQVYAVIHANDYIYMNRNNYYSPLDVELYLYWDLGYSTIDAEYGTRNCDVDWKAEAIRYIEFIDKDGEYGPKGDYISHLMDYNFTEEEARYAVDNCGKDWNNHALICLRHYVNDLCDTPPNYSQCTDKLQDWGFTSSEIQWAFDNFEGEIYPDQLNYQITFDPNGGTLSTNKMNVTYGKNYKLPTPERTGYTFLGWYNGTSKVEDGVWKTASNVTLKAEWIEKGYSITYKLNGGINNPNNPNGYTIKDSFTLFEPTKEGYTFNGWTYAGQVTPTLNLTIDAGTTGNLTFTAHWTANTYTVYYDANGGTYDKSSEEVEYDSSFTPGTPTREGYTFEGWFFRDGGEYTSQKYNNPSDSYLVAKWKAKTYYIYYDVNGGTLGNTKQAVEYDSNYTLAEPTRTGYSFEGWFDENSIQAQDGKWQSTENLYLEARWNANEYKITFNADGGSVDTSEMVVEFDSDVTLPTPTRTGYIFAGWYSGKTIFNSGTWKTAKDVDLVAKWTARSDIKYVVNHWQENIYDDEYILFETEILEGTSDKNVTPSVKKYTGFTSPSKKTVSVAPDGTTVVDYYYARNEYTIDFVTNGGNSVESITLKYGSKLDIPEATREDYTFGGWYTDSSLSDSYSDSTMPAYDRVVYAWWEEENKPTDFTYTGSSEIKITGYNGSSSTMHIPSYIGGKPVTAIKEYAFKNQTIITSVFVPETVEFIGEGAFKGCNSITEMTLPFVGESADCSDPSKQTLGHIFGYEIVNTENYKTSSGYTYQGYFYSSVVDTSGATANNYYGHLIPSSLKSVTITSQSNIPNNAFRNCDSIERIIIKGGTTSIGDKAFMNCTSLVEVRVPESVSSIGSYAFYKCSSLTYLNSSKEGEINIPNLVTRIEDRTFMDCSAITSVNMSNNVTYLGKYAFANCSNMIRLNSSNDYELILPTSCETLSGYAFSNLKQVKKIVVPKNTTTIELYCFYKCSSVEELVIPFIPSETNYWGDHSGLGSLFYIYYSGSGYNNELAEGMYLTYSYSSGGSAGTYKYAVPISLRKVTVTNSNKIDDNTFYGMKYLEEVIIEGSNVSIGSKAFYNCSALTKITLPASYTYETNSFTGSGVKDQFK